VAALRGAGEVHHGAERIAVVLQDILRGEILGEDRLALAQVREQFEDEIFLEIVALAVRYAAQHAVEERERAGLERHRPVRPIDARHFGTMSISGELRMNISSCCLRSPCGSLGCRPSMMRAAFSP
jgi:hypothetical protein